VRQSLAEQLVSIEKVVAVLSDAKMKHDQERRLKQSALNNCKQKDMELNRLKWSLESTSAKYSEAKDSLTDTQTKLFHAKSELAHLQIEVDVAKAETCTAQLNFNSVKLDNEQKICTLQA